MKKTAAVLLAAALCAAGLTGCGKTPTGAETAAPAGAETAAPAQSQPEGREANQAESKEDSQTESQEENKAAILLVSFGTSYNDSRDSTIGAVEKAVEEAFPDYEVRRAFTSQIIIDILKEREKLSVDNVEEALDRAVADGVKELIVQPTHLMEGYEYHDLEDALAEYSDQFDKILFGAPLLTSEEDFAQVIRAITEQTASYDDGETAVCFMGHGTEAEANRVYSLLQEKLWEEGHDHYYIGTVEASPSLSDVLTAMKEKQTYRRVILQPLMVVAGDHANNDMAGDEEDSWKTAFEQEGYEVECVLEGLGQIPGIQDIYVDHVKAAIEADIPFEGVKEERTPGSAAALSDGTFETAVEASSSMFRVVKAELAVAGDEMTVVLTLGGTGYGKLFMGTAEEAAAAAEEDFIPFVEDAEGAYTYEIPVEALDIPLACAAFSTKKQEWYDRQLTFLSSSASGQAACGTIADGTYEIEVTLEGGSGKSTVLSPAVLTVEGGVMTAAIQWNSPNYDYMVVDGEKYLAVSMEGGSVFEIPVRELDTELPVIGDTVAMSKPHEIDYVLIFHGVTMQAK